MPGSFSATIRCSLLAASDAEHDRQHEDRHHPEEVDREVGLGPDQRRTVPQAVHDHRPEVSEQDAAGLGDRVAVLEREVDADSEHRREERVCERAHDQPKGGGEQGVAQGFATGDVEDVLQPGETGADEARVHQAVGQRVELVASPAGHHEQQKRALGRLLDNGRDDGDRTQLPSPDSPGAISESRYSDRITDRMTATEAPQRNAKTSSRGGSGSHRSSHM